jgi:glucose-6-phosphate dehydrogenase assembly protein OpcA
MPATAENYSLGLQVELDKIDKELKKLWQEGEGAMTRASLINLAVYSEEPGSLEKNTQLVAKITEDHACRALVIFADRSAKEDHVDAWISAHCHVTHAGSKQVCSEQLSFWLQGLCAKLLPSIVFSHVDSDLPLNLWWQGEFHDPMNPQLWEWVDRLIYDSQVWQSFADQFRLIETAQREARQRIVLCDLNWTRLDRIRCAVAQFFDHPASHHHLGKIHNAQIDFAPGYRSTGVLFAGWLGAQLNWGVDSTDGASFRFLNANGRKIDIELRENDGPPIGEVVIKSTEAEFSVAPAQCGDLLEVSRRRRPNEEAASQLMPAQCYDLADLMTQELLRGGPHHVYLGAVNCVRDWL